MPPSSRDIFHLLMAIKITTAINIMKSKETEQKSPLLLTRTAVPRFIALEIIHGRGSLQNKRRFCLQELCNGQSKTCILIGVGEFKTQY